MIKLEHCDFAFYVLLKFIFLILLIVFGVLLKAASIEGDENFFFNPESLKLKLQQDIYIRNKPYSGFNAICSLSIATPLKCSHAERGRGFLYTPLWRLSAFQFFFQPSPSAPSLSTHPSSQPFSSTPSLFLLSPSLPSPSSFPPSFSPSYPSTPFLSPPSSSLQFP